VVGARAGLPLLLVLMVAAFYAGSFGNGFHFDDFHAVVLNPHIRDLTRIPSFFYSAGAFSVNPESAMYRPLLLSTFAINYALSGATASGFHVVNVLLHGLAAVATLSWLRRVGFRPRVAGVTALLFAVHPINSEAVCCSLRRCISAMLTRAKGAGFLPLCWRLWVACWPNRWVLSRHSRCC